MANNLSIDQSYAVFNTIAEQATGKTNIAVNDTNSFVAQAQTVLKTGYDPVINAVSQVLSRTVFSVRPYSAKFKGLMMDPVKWGNHVRKIQVADKPLESDNRYSLTDGQSIDMYKVNKPKVLQTNFYGQSTFAKSTTIFKDQLDTAFENGGEFGNFISMQMSNVNDILEQNRENVARATICNMIGAKVIADSANVIYLFDKYYDETGISLTETTYRTPTNFAPFMKWLFAYIKTISGLMAERSVKFHKNYTVGGETLYISRHTPLERQKLYLYTKELNDMDASVMSDTFHTNFLNLMDHEEVNYWQSIDTPMGIQVRPSYVDANGAVVEAPNTLTIGGVLGILFDEEAIGYTPIEQYSLATPMNAAGAYTNIIWHENLRTFNDLTENCVVFVLGNAPELGSIAITTAPTKTTYAVGEYFDPTGMVVTATYTNNMTMTIPNSELTYSPTLTTALASTDVKDTVSYTEGLITKTADQAITVS